MPRKGWRKNLVANNTNGPTLHAGGNGTAIQFADVLSYFKNKSHDAREQAIDAIRAMGTLGLMPRKYAKAEKPTEPETNV